MKIAVIFTGHMRGYEMGWEALKKYLIDPLGRDAFDIFIHTWSDIGFYTGKGYLKPRSDGFINTEENELGFYPTGNINKEHILELYDPREIVIDDFALYNGLFEEKRKRYENAFTRPKNTLSQFYKIMLGTELLQNYSDHFNVKYDVVVRMRPDLVLCGPLPVIHDTIFYTNQGTNSKRQGIGDQIHISSYDNIVKFGQLYNHIDELYSKLGYSCPHAYSELWLQQLGIPYEMNIHPCFIQHGPHGPYKEPDTGLEHKPER